MRIDLPAAREPKLALAIAAILAVAVAIRIAVFQPYALAHPDEAIQYLEQAHRLVFGYGIEPWEYRYGMRNWLVPLVLSGPMWLAAQIMPATTTAPVLAARSLAALIALVPIGAAYALGARLSRLHALVAMAVVAVWVESIYFSVHVLTETLSVAAFLPAAALIRNGTTRGRLAAGGALLALTVMLRLQYAPAVAVFALAALGTRRHDWLAVIAGGLAVVAGQALLDIAMGGLPLGWMVENFRQNLVNHRAAGFGTAPPSAYLATLRYYWAFALVPMLVLVAVVRRQYPALLAAALANLALHMAIGHKEYRFIWLTVEILVLLAAIGSAQVLALVLDHIGAGRRRRGLWHRARSRLGLGVRRARHGGAGQLARAGGRWSRHRAGRARPADLRDRPRRCRLLGRRLFHPAAPPPDLRSAERRPPATRRARLQCHHRGAGRRAAARLPPARLLQRPGRGTLPLRPGRRLRPGGGARLSPRRHDAGPRSLTRRATPS
jgi:hypothetical protein